MTLIRTISRTLIALAAVAMASALEAMDEAEIAATGPTTSEIGPAEADPGVLKPITKVPLYFRSDLGASFELRRHGCGKLVIPCERRWYATTYCAPKHFFLLNTRHNSHHLSPHDTLERLAQQIEQVEESLALCRYYAPRYQEFECQGVTGIGNPGWLRGFAQRAASFLGCLRAMVEHPMKMAGRHIQFPYTNSYPDDEKYEEMVRQECGLGLSEASESDTESCGPDGSQEDEEKLLQRLCLALPSKALRQRRRSSTFGD